MDLDEDAVERAFLLGCRGYSWQPEVGWHAIFVDDLQGQEGSIKEFLQHSVYELQAQKKIEPLSERRGGFAGSDIYSS